MPYSYKEMQKAIKLEKQAIGLFEQEQYEAALPLFMEALSAFGELKQAPGPALLNLYIGSCLIQLSRFKPAIAKLENALFLFKKHAPKQTEHIIICHNNIGMCCNKMGDHDRAYRHYKNELELRLGNKTSKAGEVAMAYNNVGRAYESKGFHEQAAHYYNKALELIKNEPGETALKAVAYNNLGNIFYHRGDFEQALQYHTETLRLRKSIMGENSPECARSHGNMGACCSRLGKFEHTLAHYQTALNIYLAQKKEPNNPGVARMHNNIGFAHLAKGDFEQALIHFNEALELRLPIFGKNHPLIGIAYQNIGKTLLRQNKGAEALQWCEKAVEITQNALPAHHPDLAVRLLNVVACNMHLKRYSDALQTMEQVMCCLLPDAGKPHSAVEAFSEILLIEALHKKAQCLQKLQNGRSAHNLEPAIQCCQQAAKRVSTLRKQYLSEESKLALGAQAGPLYATGLDIAYQLYQVTGGLQYVRHAFAFAENGKAMLLLSGIKDLDARKAAGIPQTLVKREEYLRLELTYLNRQIKHTHHQTEAVENAELLDEWLAQRFTLQSEYNQLMRQFKLKYLKYYELKYAMSTPTPAQLQSILPNEQTAVVEFAWGEAYGYAFVIKKAGVTLRRFEKQLDMDKQIMALRTAILQMDKRVYLQKATELYQALFAGIEADLSQTEMLYLIPDGEMAYLPFEALLTQPPPTDLKPKHPSLAYGKLPYLLRHFTLSYHYSAALLLRAAQLPPRKEKGGLLAFAPFGQARNAAESQRQKNRATSPTPVLRNEKHQALHHSLEEVAEVADLFNSQGKKTAIFTEKTATLDNFLDVSGRYGNILLSTHAVFNEQQPDLSCILFYGKSSPQPLYLADVFNLRLHAGLVVLSACESGMGSIAKGEGMMGVGRGFLYAGVRKLVFTLFKVDDRLSKQFVVHFFKELSVCDDEAAALRLAKQHLIAHPGITPAAWAGFVMVG